MYIFRSCFTRSIWPGEKEKTNRPAFFAARRRFFFTPSCAFARYWEHRSAQTLFAENDLSKPNQQTRKLSRKIEDAAK
jgi:hypothetical protein